MQHHAGRHGNGAEDRPGVWVMIEAIGIILLAAGTYLCGWLKGKGIG